MEPKIVNPYEAFMKHWENKNYESAYMISMENQKVVPIIIETKGYDFFMNCCKEFRENIGPKQGKLFYHSGIESFVNEGEDRANERKPGDYLKSIEQREVESVLHEMGLM